MFTPDDQLADLRRYAEQVRRGKEAAKLRDQEILRLRDQINPRTGRRFTWSEIAEAADLSRIGATDASKRIANRTIKAS